MKLQAIKATETEPQTILCFSDNNKFASISKWGTIKLFGEDMSIDLHELRQAHVIAENFDLFYSNLIEKDTRIAALETELNPILNLYDKK